MTGRALRAAARVALLALCPGHISQRALERLLGVSQGYLSRLRASHGAAVPSAALVAALALLANDPGRRLDELQDYWVRHADGPET